MLPESFTEQTLLQVVAVLQVPCLPYLHHPTTAVSQGPGRGLSSASATLPPLLFAYASERGEVEHGDVLQATHHVACIWLPCHMNHALLPLRLWL